MSEKPILFSGPMVRAILDGRKTQTRRIVKPQPQPHTEVWHRDEGVSRHTDAWHESVVSRAPYQAGDHLWVRETWGIHSKSWTDCGWENDGLIEFSTRTPREDLICNGSHKIRQVAYAAHGYEPCREGGEAGWKPSIHMPRWASRITLEVVSVKVERLQDISQADAIAEGGPLSHASIDAVSRDFGYPDFSRSWFAQLWEPINGEGSWDANPWVWVVEFKRIKPEVTT